MSKIIDTIEGEPITLGDDGKIRYKAKAAIDDDGIGKSHGDPDFQNNTTLQQNGHALNADEDRYIAIPPAIIAGVAPIVLGSQAHVTNTRNGKTCSAVVGDIGPHRKLGKSPSRAPQRSASTRVQLAAEKNGMWLSMSSSRACPQW